MDMHAYEMYSYTHNTSVYNMCNNMVFYGCFMWNFEGEAHALETTHSSVQPQNIGPPQVLYFNMLAIGCIP